MITRDTMLTNQDVIHRMTVRSAYDTAEGRAELVRLLTDLGTFREITPAELPLRNYGIRKLEEMGFLDIEAIIDVVNFLFTLPEAQRPTREELEEMEQSGQ